VRFPEIVFWDDVELRFDGAWIKLAALTSNFFDILFSLVINQFF
jgi:hypothetical protein